MEGNINIITLPKQQYIFTSSFKRKKLIALCIFCIQILKLTIQNYTFNDQKRILTIKGVVVKFSLQFLYSNNLVNLHHSNFSKLFREYLKQPRTYKMILVVLYIYFLRIFCTHIHRTTSTSFQKKSKNSNIVLKFKF